MKRNLSYFFVCLLGCLCVSCDSLTSNANDTNTKAYTPGQAVDLGLSVLWSDINIGASDVFDPGIYLGWGEITTKNSYIFPNYTYGSYDYSDGKMIWNKYFYEFNTPVSYYPFGSVRAVSDNQYGNVDNKTVLDSIDDPAIYYWGDEWRVPSSSEWSELITSCTWEYHDAMSSANAYYTVTGPNNNSIIITLNGKANLLPGAYTNGHYWTNTLSSKWPSLAFEVYLSKDEIYKVGSYRWFGYNIRPVKDK